MGKDWKMPSIPKIIQLLTQAQALQKNITTNNSTNSDDRALILDEKRTPVPAYGLGIGKNGNRAYVSTIKSGTKETPNKEMDSESINEMLVPQFESCNQRSSGYILDRDFYYEWQEEDECKKNATETPTKISDGVETPPLPNGYKMVWNDEFDGNKLDLNKWEYEVNCLGGGNNEEQCYVAHDDVLKLEDGKLVITAIRAPEGYALMPYDKCNADPDSMARGACTNRKPVRSARIHTRADLGGKWKYGRFEMKAKIPIGNFLWPAFWMLPSNYRYGTWAASGEFDIMESRGQKPDEIGHALHYGAAWPNNVYSNLQYVQQGLADDFNIYGLDWDEKSIKFFVNHRYTYQLESNRNWTSPLLHSNSPYTQPGQPWDQEFIMLLNLAVGGTFFSGAKYNPNEDYKTWRQPFIVDYIRVYQKS